jgi:hypothetical protein
MPTHSASLLSERVCHQDLFVKRPPERGCDSSLISPGVTTQHLPAPRSTGGIATASVPRKESIACSAALRPEEKHSRCGLGSTRPRWRGARVSGPASRQASAPYQISPRRRSPQTWTASSRRMQGRRLQNGKEAELSPISISGGFSDLY